ncbi:MAG: sialate O-acetylesterase, partial [Chitinophagaceae bacterium]
MIVFVISAVCTRAQTKLPIFFGDSMILQQQTQSAIWGTDNANTTISVIGSWGASNTTTTDISGRWKLNIQTPSAGGPYTVTVRGSREIIFRNIMIGEVWFCAGQSNMEMPMKGYDTDPPQTVDSSAFFIANSTNINIRMFKSGWNPVSRTPLYEVSSGKWNSASPASTPDISATAYFFARKLQLELGIPVGIIITARGGTSIESWMDSATIATVKPVEIPETLNWQTAHTTPVQMYNTFLHPFIGYTIKGVIWSQGEANISRHQEYFSLFTRMIALWRNKWGIGDFPFYFAQIVPNGGTTNQNSAFFREAQLNTMLLSPNTGMASTMDIATQVSVHYPKKKVVGDRLAEWALIKNYGKRGTPSGPVFKSLTISNDVINLRFDYSGFGLTSFGNGFSDFEIAGADKVYYPATATLADYNYSINVRSSSVRSPLYVRYAFKNFVVGSLFNAAGLPAPSFRTESMQEIISLLPVQFGTVKILNTNIGTRQIEWNTLSEIDIESYDIERSINGVNFTTIGNILAKRSNANYMFEDETNKTNNIVYYRIKAIN